MAGTKPLLAVVLQELLCSGLCFVFGACSGACNLVSFKFWFQLSFFLVQLFRLLPTRCGLYFPRGHDLRTDLWSFGVWRWTHELASGHSQAPNAHTRHDVARGYCLRADLRSFSSYAGRARPQGLLISLGCSVCSCLICPFGSSFGQVTVAV